MGLLMFGVRALVERLRRPPQSVKRALERFRP